MFQEQIIVWIKGHRSLIENNSTPPRPAPPTSQQLGSALPSTTNNSNLVVDDLGPGVLVRCADD